MTSSTGTNLGGVLNSGGVKAVTVLYSGDRLAGSID